MAKTSISMLPRCARNGTVICSRHVRSRPHHSTRAMDRRTFVRGAAGVAGAAATGALGFANVDDANAQSSSEPRELAGLRPFPPIAAITDEERLARIEK